MPKKQSKNSFWFFMSEWKTAEEKKGRTFPNGFRDVQADPECNSAWQALTPAQKAPYIAKAKKAKKEIDYDKKTGTGESVAMIREEEKMKQDFQMSMEEYIRSTVSEAKKYKSLSGLHFFFMHMNIYYMRTPDGEPVDFCPAEFAIAEFSIENGVTRHYNQIVKTSIHLGYTREAMETSEKSHKLHWDLPIGEDDWSIMYHKLMNFLKPKMINGKIPPIYTSKKFIHMFPSLLRRLTAAVGQHPDKFSIYSLESLFGHMLRAVTDFPESNIVAILAETQLSKQLFAYTPNIECDYHKLRDGTSQFCSLSIVRQWAFEFCDQCCRSLGVTMIPEIHCPGTAEMALCNNTVNNSFHLSNDRSISVLSATGVSEQHRISVSERSRDEEARRRRTNGRVEIIDHSLLKDEELQSIPEPEPELPAVALPSVSQIPQMRLRAPSTASQALIGLSRVAPIFNGENFPAIGGRGIRRSSETNRPVGPIWSHRGRKNSDSD